MYALKTYKDIFQGAVLGLAQVHWSEGIVVKLTFKVQDVAFVIGGYQNSILDGSLIAIFKGFLFFVLAKSQGSDDGEDNCKDNDDFVDDVGFHDLKPLSIFCCHQILTPFSDGKAIIKSQFPVQFAFNSEPEIRTNYLSTIGFHHDRT